MKFFGNEITMQTQTNADRIRAMSDEELAVFLEQTQADVAFYKKSMRLNGRNGSNSLRRWSNMIFTAFVAGFLAGVIIMACLSIGR